MEENEYLKKLQKKLFELQDTEYKEFQCRLMPTVEKDTVIGVRIPQLRKLAKEMAKHPETVVFLEHLPHRYYEENNLHGYLLEQERDFEKCIKGVETFLSYVDNWATCDTCSPKVFQKHLPELLIKIDEWLVSDMTYTVRFAIRMLMNFYLGENFLPEYMERVAQVKSDEYYVNMMIAWYFATALAKQYACAIRYLEEKQLDVWTHNKAIQKAVESRRIDEEKKVYLRTLKI